MRVNTRGAAAYVGVSKSTLDKLRVHGGGPTYLKVGRKVLYETGHLDEWLTSLCRASTSEAIKGAGA